MNAAELAAALRAENTGDRLVRYRHGRSGGWEVSVDWEAIAAAALRLIEGKDEGDDRGEHR